MESEEVDLVAENEKKEKFYNPYRRPHDDEKMYFPSDVSTATHAFDILRKALATQKTEAIHGTSQSTSYGRLHLCQCYRGQQRKEVRPCCALLFITLVTNHFFQVQCRVAKTKKIKARSTREHLPFQDPSML